MVNSGPERCSNRVRADRGTMSPPLFQDLVSVHIDEDLGHRWGEGRGHTRQLRPLARIGQELLGVLPQEGDVLARPILDHHGYAARVAAALNGRWRESE